MKLENIEELIVGAVVGFAFIPYVCFNVIWMCPVTAMLWWLGGASASALQNVIPMPAKIANMLTQKIWRRLGVPVVICLTLAVCLRSWIPLLFILPFYATLTIGYGIPDGHDQGSPLGRFICWTCDLDPWDSELDAVIADCLVRFTIAAIIAISVGGLMFIAPPIKWIVLSITLVILYPLAVIAVD